MISLKLQHVTWISSPQAYLKEGTAIIQLVMFDDQIGSLIYLCSPVLKLICLDQDSIEVCLKSITIFSAFITMEVSLSLIVVFY